ncbi:hypothetical protein M5D96_010848, partial [Drosophila gunungcola]
SNRYLHTSQGEDVLTNSFGCSHNVPFGAQESGTLSALIAALCKLSHRRRLGGRAKGGGAATATSGTTDDSCWSSHF